MFGSAKTYCLKVDDGHNWSRLKFPGFPCAARVPWRKFPACLGGLWDKPLDIKVSPGLVALPDAELTAFQSGADGEPISVHESTSGFIFMT